MSGGERQRVALARVLLRASPILLLDEATSALDTTTEVHVQEALQDACKGRTTIFISHRLNAVSDADRIVVLSDGSVCEEGTHEELIEK
uniref:ABC transporter domain-containing protein n=1 Tax=Guillardia theta (strain CCMP2712) TaxID=905079 RepID=A0A0C3TRV3_GUITC